MTNKMANHNGLINFNNMYELKQTFEVPANLIDVASIDIKLSTVKCWWNNEVTECHNEFLMSFIDSSLCFIFNQNSTAIALGNRIYKGMYGIFISRSTISSCLLIFAYFIQDTVIHCYFNAANKFEKTKRY